MFCEVYYHHWISDHFSNNYFHFGVLEKIDIFAGKLNEKLNADIKPAHEKKTLVRAIHDISSEDRKKIEKLYERDFVVYETVNEIV